MPIIAALSPQARMGGTVTHTPRFSSAAAIAALGVVLCIVVKVLDGALHPEAPAWGMVSNGIAAVFVLAALCYFVFQSVRKRTEAHD